MQLHVTVHPVWLFAQIGVLFLHLTVRTHMLCCAVLCCAVLPEPAGCMLWQHYYKAS